MTSSWIKARRIGAALAIFALCSLTLALYSILSHQPLSAIHPSSKSIATTYGLISTAASFTQFLPQLYKTMKNRRIGALSVEMMMIQTPGSFLFVYSIMIQPGTDWTSWLSYLVAGTFQGMLLSLCLYLRCHGEAIISEEERALIEEGNGAVSDEEENGNSATVCESEELQPEGQA